MRVPRITLLLFLVILLAAPHACAIGDSKPSDAVVIVLYQNQYGTGWWVNHDYVVTAAHVVNYDLHGAAELIRGDWRSEGIVVYVNQETDIAVLKVRHPPAMHPVLPVASKVETGKNLYVVGYPFEIVQLTNDIEAASTTPRVAEGFAAWYRPEYHLLEFQATTDAGNSGGPVVYANGVVVGVVSFAMKGKVGTLYFATTCDALTKDLERAGVGYQKADPPKEPSPDSLLRLEVTQKTVSIAAGAMSIILALISLAMYLRGGRT